MSLPRSPKTMSLPGPPSKVWLPTPRRQPSGHDALAAIGAGTIVSPPPPPLTVSTPGGATMTSAQGVPRIVSPIVAGPAAQLGPAGSSGRFHVPPPDTPPTKITRPPSTPPGNPYPYVTPPT